MAPSEKKKKQRLIFGIVGGIFLACVIIVPITIEVIQDKNKTEVIPEESNLNSRIECFPLDTVTKESCENAGCLWEPVPDNNVTCFLPDSSKYGYQVNGPLVPSANGFKIDLRRIQPVPSLYGGDFEFVTFQVTYHTDYSLSFALFKNGTTRESWRPPVEISTPSSSIVNQHYTVQLTSTAVGQPFNLQIIRKSSNVVIFDTSMGGLTLAQQFLMISTKLPSKYLYGLGENTHDAFLHDLHYRTWPIFTRDIAPEDADVNLYGAHPFYMVSEMDGSSHGVFFFNSHSIDVTTMPYPGLTFRTIGGMLEFFVFLGPEPETVVQQYTEVIGRPFMPPYFSLGFQLSRWGYKDTAEIRQVIQRNKELGIPHDVQYADIDYMDGRRDFTIDPVNFGDLPQLVNEVKADGLRFIVILDPAIANDYDTYERGKTAGVYVEWADPNNKPDNQPTDNNIVFGNVWPDNKTAFPDFFKSSTKQWWRNEMKAFYDRLQYDAIWIDMNEVSNFDTNVWSDKLNCTSNKWDDPPYPTMASRIGPTHRISDKTICMDTKFGENGEYLHYNVHNLYGYSQSIATQSAVRNITGKRSMVLSRSTYAGSGQYAGHWLGDNFSRWSAMADSIIGMMEFNLFGMPYIGADICGFNDETTEEMCERWMELGAFYPFSRNHNSIGKRDQDPAVWPATVASSGRKALNIRYRLLPYLYTLFYDSHTTGSTVVRPLYHEYPWDLTARTIDRQFLWGPALMISPVLEPGKTTVDVYIPDDVWYDYYTGAQVTVLGNVTLDAPRDFINVHVRGGYILPAQKPGLNTKLSRENNFELLIALKDNQARGKLFWDDGESVDTVSKGQYQINTFELSQNTLTMMVEKGESAADIAMKLLDVIYIMGWPARPVNITIDEKELAYTYIESTKRLTVHCELKMNETATINFI